MICLKGSNLHKSYQDSDQMIQVLCGTDIAIEENSMVCITGQSGCGKSTLMHILGLLDSPDEGSIELFGKEVTSRAHDTAMIRNRDLGFVFQFHYLVDDLTALENVALPLMIGGKNFRESSKRAQELISWFGLSARQSHYPHQLSGGEQQRIAIARALANSPKIVLADEPTGNLDPDHSHEVWETIQRLNREFGQTFVIVTHEPKLAEMTSTRYVLAQGVLSKL
ncbi:MAG: ABC transporter ATP-binding protein [Candidatus Cloacimonetes bacterium]|nr:ABC transporter ATP-binding protein [Candidatus Cloacimonadota bacterium]